jgi:hypothetical protein
MDFSAGFWEFDFFKAGLRGASSRLAFNGTDEKKHKNGLCGLADHTLSYFVVSWITCLLKLLSHEVLRFDILKVLLMAGNTSHQYDHNF